jgi:hypothetical protein
LTAGHLNFGVADVSEPILPLADAEPFDLPPDRRPRLVEPPPVKLVAVSDVRRHAPAGVEVELDAFYRDLLQFERDDTPSGYPIYRAEKRAIVFDVVEPPIRREDLRPLGIEVPNLFDVEQQLTAQGMVYERITKLLAGQDGLLLQDPAGNWVALANLRILW